MPSNFVECFGTLEDKRVQGRSTYPLLEILFLSIGAILSGAEGWESIEDFGVAKLNWLRNYLPYEQGIPRHDTIARVIARICPKALRNCFISWVKSVTELTDGEVIAIDGKQARRSYDKRSRRSALHMVSAWACANGVVLGQQKTADKSNEITAIPQLLEILALKGCIVTIDAMGCQKAIAEKIVNADADYMLALKGNQGTLHDAIKDFFQTALDNDFKNIAHQQHQEVDGGHGRIEQRTCYTVSVPDYLKPLTKPWKKLSTLVCLQSIRQVGDKTQTEARYYLSSLHNDAKRCSSVIRQHWAVENSLHWVLDVSFKEDDSRIRRGEAANNFTIMRHLSLNLLKKENSTMTIPRKRRKANYYDDYRSELIKNLGF